MSGLVMAMTALVAGEVAARALAVGWALLVAVALVSMRPRRRRLLPVPPGAGRRAHGPLVTLGGAVRRSGAHVLGRAPPDDDALGELWIGAAVVLVGALAVTLPPLAPLPVVLALAGPRPARRRVAEAERRAWADALPDAVDLLALGLGSGLGVAPALALVAPRTPAPLGPALIRAHQRIVHGDPLATALERVAEQGPITRPLVALLVTAHQDGAPVVDPLTRLAGDLRADRRRAVEARARQIPIRLLFPLVFCSLPAFVLLAIVPPVVAALTDLRA